MSFLKIRKKGRGGVEKDLGGCPNIKQVALRIILFPNFNSVPYSA